MSTRLTTFEPREALAHVLETIRLLRRELEGRVPLDRFRRRAVHAWPPTPSKAGHRRLPAHEDVHVRAAASWHRLCALFADAMTTYLRAQVDCRRAGAADLRFVGRRAGPGRLSRVRAAAHQAHLRWPRRRRRPAHPLRRWRDGHLAGSRRCRRRRDWRRLASGSRRRLDDRSARRAGIQGNLDPARLFGPRDRLLAAADDVLRRAAGRPGHIFNLGHGGLPKTPVENVQALAEHVHATDESAARVADAGRFSNLPGSAFSTHASRIPPCLIIIGGGITGLAAAYELATRQIPFVLLEASDRLGGLGRAPNTSRATRSMPAPTRCSRPKPAAIELCESSASTRD